MCVVLQKKGNQVHDKNVRQGALQNNIVLGNTLDKMYVDHGAISTVQQVVATTKGKDMPRLQRWIVVQGEWGQKGSISMSRLQADGSDKMTL